MSIIFFGCASSKKQFKQGNYEAEIGGVGDSDSIYIDVMPSFMGGDLNTFREWTQSKVTYPQAAIDAKIQGQVCVQFIVEPNGSVSTVTIVQGLGSVIDDEVIKVIQSSPKWSPGFQQGQAVRIRYSFWLNFIL